MEIDEILRIPVIEYLLVFVLAGLIALGLWIAGLLRNGVARVQLISEKSN